MLDLSTLESAVVCSLRSHRRNVNERGYWVDALTGESFGSRLWLLERAYLNKDTVRLAEEYCKEALEWLLQKQLIKEIQVKGEIQDARLILTILLDGKSLEYGL